MAEIAATAAAGKGVETCFVVAKKHIGYMCNYPQIVQKLRSGVEKLKDTKEGVDRLVEEAKNRGENIEENVTSWVKNANSEISDVTIFLGNEENAKKTCCNISWFVNLYALYSYGKRAQAKTTSVLEHDKEGNDLKTKPVSYATRAPEHFDLCKRVNNLDDFATQKIAFDNIIETILDDTKQIVGVYGLGGVGKTTLANEAGRKLQLERQFDKVEFVKVTQTVDVASIKEQVSEGARRIINGERVLFIFDDVWSKLDLMEVGIPCGVDYKKCKILFTCRSKDVCVHMNADSSICVDTLTYDEACKLFKSIVGQNQETEFLHEALIKECGGLPLMIEAVGNDLKTKPTRIWQAALARLQDIKTQQNFSSIDKALSRLQLSYDNHENEEAKSCFLLCSLFKEDGDIEVERLTRYGVSLEIFKDLDGIRDARNRVKTAVDNLSCSTLLLLDENEKLKMHNIGRKVVLFVISKRKEREFLKAGKGMRDWPLRPGAAKSYTKISLMGNKICRLPEHEQDFELVDAFLIQENELRSFPDNFFQGMKRVKLLDMSSNMISCLPRSLRLLQELRFLDLSNNKSLNDISILGELTALEILSLKSTGIKKIPEEIGNLINLRLLDVENCENLFYVENGVISKLIYLEELRIGFLEQMESYECLKEIGKRTSLKILFLSVPRCDLIPEDNYFEQLEEFRIQTARLGCWDQVKFTPDIKRRLRVHGSSFPFTMPVKKLICLSDAIELFNIEDVDNILPDLYHEGFDADKLQGCDNVKCLVKTHDLIPSLKRCGSRSQSGT